MQRDIRDTDLFKALAADTHRMLRPGSGLVVSASDVQASPDGKWMSFTGVVVDKLQGTPGTRVCVVDAKTGAQHTMTSGSGSQRAGRWSPDGSTLAYLSDREQAGNFQLQLLSIRDSLSRSGPAVPGFVESLQWSASGEQILLGVADPGADLAGAQGGTNAALGADDAPDWAPSIHSSERNSEWRRAWVVDMGGGVNAQTAKAITPPGLNVWESAWCGAGGLVASASDSPEEAAWYTARVVHCDAQGHTRNLYQPLHQLGGITASPSGRHAAVVEAICSDRTIFAGDVVLIDVASASARKLDLNGIDISHLAWCDDRTLMAAGHRSFETVLCRVDIESGQVQELWRSRDCTFGGPRYPEFSLASRGNTGAVVSVVEGFTQRPAVSVVSADGVQALFTLGDSATAADVAALAARVEPVTWAAPDGLEIHGWLIVPHSTGPSPGPFPTVLEVHGGPVWQFRHVWLGNTLLRRQLLREGYAQLLVNPRGSSGRGQDHAGRVFGDMGGADTHDFLSGMDALVARGVTDPANQFVWGGSYGGYMSSWLVTQDTRFAAAVPVSPVTDWISEHLTSQVGIFCRLFLADEMQRPGSKYVTRSPIMGAAQVSTPVMLVCGALDRNTPPGQALEFHNALLEQGKKSVLLTYPKDGHGVRSYPAAIDFAARVVGWFGQHRTAHG
jgi:dipeptidyl aminopeptidase/acylaminoacyl peptidase